MSAPTADATRSCTQCGYDLRAHSDTATCPECGTPWLSGPVEFIATEHPGYDPAGNLKQTFLIVPLAILVSANGAFPSVPFPLRFASIIACALCVGFVFRLLRDRQPENTITLRFTSEGITALSTNLPPRFQPWLPDITAKCTPTRLSLPGTITVADAFDLGEPFLKFHAQLTPGLAAGLERQIKQWSSPTLPTPPDFWGPPKERAHLTAEETRTALLPYLRCPNCLHEPAPCSSPDHGRPDNAIYVIPADDNRFLVAIAWWLPIPMLFPILFTDSLSLSLAVLLILLVMPLLLRLPRPFPLHARFTEHGWQVSHPSAPLKLRPYKGSSFNVSGTAVGVTTLKHTRWIGNFQWYEKKLLLFLPAQASWALLNLPIAAKRPT